VPELFILIFCYSLCTLTRIFIKHW